MFESTAYMPKQGKIRVEFQVPPAMKEAWDREAEDRGLALSAWIRDTLNKEVLNARAHRANLRREADEQPVKPKR